MKEKNTTLANEKSVLLIDAETLQNREARWFPNRYLLS